VRRSRSETGRSEAVETADRQYRIGVLNRRIMAHVRSLDRLFTHVTGEAGATVFFCACGRDECRETITVPIEVYEDVRRSPHTFVVAPGHGMPIDELLVQGDGYDVVEIKPEHRLPDPPTGPLSF
jgi:hypothetical protein